MGKMKAFCSFSGGKDSILSLFRVLNQGVEVPYLFNMLREDGKYSRSHGIHRELLRKQAESIGIPILQRSTSWKDYEENFKKTVEELKKEGVKAGIFGDIYLQEHRDWVERVCKELKIKPILPLWEEKTEDLIVEFINTGFKAIIVATEAKILNKDWLGLLIDRDCIEKLKVKEKIDLCGERGEYHTFVIDGPIFKKRIKIIETKKVKNARHWFLEILKYRLEEKQ